MGFRRTSLPLTLIDGFAGGGEFIKGNNEVWLGSPFILMKAVSQVKKEILANSSNFNLDVDFIFTERNEAAYKSLKHTFHTFQKNEYGIDSSKIEILLADITEKIDNIISFVKRKHKSERCIFLFDPCGHTELGNLFTLFEKIFTSLKSPEIIFTFQIDWLVHYLNLKNGRNPILEKMGFSTSTIKKICDIGDDTDESQKNKRLAAQKIIYEAIITQNNVRFFTPFCIKSPKSHKSYILLHLANHVRARDVMIETHWNPDIANSFIHEGTAGYNMLSNLPDAGEAPYLFNDLSKEETIEKLTKDLINKKLLYDSLIPADNLYMQLCNEITASREIFYSVLKKLVHEKIIEAYKDKDGNFTQTISINDGIYIRKHRQRKLFIFP